MQAPDMLALRSLHLYKTLRILSTRKRNPIITCCSSRNHPRFPKKFTPFAKKFTTATTGRVVTKRDYNDSKEVDPVVKNAENPSGMEVGSKVYGDVIGCSRSVRSSMKKGQSRRNCGYSARPRAQGGGTDLDDQGSLHRRRWEDQFSGVFAGIILGYMMGMEGARLQSLWQRNCISTSLKCWTIFLIKIRK